MNISAVNGFLPFEINAPAYQHPPAGLQSPAGSGLETHQLVTTANNPAVSHQI